MRAASPPAPRPRPRTTSRASGSSSRSTHAGAPRAAPQTPLEPARSPGRPPSLHPTTTKAPVMGAFGDGGNAGPERLRDEAKDVRVGLEGLAQLLLHLAMDLADARFGDAEDVADLGERQVLDVEHHGDLALTLGQRGEGGTELVLGLGGGRRVDGVETLVGAGERVDALDRRL